MDNRKKMVDVVELFPPKRVINPEVYNISEPRMILDCDPEGMHYDALKSRGNKIASNLTNRKEKCTMIFGKYEIPR